MTREELEESVIFLRKALLDIHVGFLRGLIMEIESGELKIWDIDPTVRHKFYELLSKSGYAPQPQ